MHAIVACTGLSLPPCLIRRLRNVPLTSRRFREACRDPTAWPELHILRRCFGRKARWLSFQRWLAVRASGLQKLVLGDHQVTLSSLLMSPEANMYLPSLRSTSAEISSLAPPWLTI